MIEIIETEKRLPIYFVAESYPEYLIFRTQLERFGIDYRLQIVDLRGDGELSFVFNSVVDVLESDRDKLYDEIEKLSPSLVNNRYKMGF